ncbi:MAG: HicB-like protein [Candidatus Brocadiaceae bacterium]|nr:HicB-like protein [Candidatus Brocadiaceae bacterium]
MMRLLEKPLKLASAEKAVAFWLETAKEDGIPIPEPKGRLMYA